MKNYFIGYVGYKKHDNLRRITYGYITVEEAEKIPTRKLLLKSLKEQEDIEDAEIVSVSEISKEDLEEFEKE